MSPGVPVVIDKQDSPGESLSLFGEQRRLKQTSDLIPAGQRLSGRCGEPHSGPAVTDMTVTLNTHEDFKLKVS